MRTKPLAPEAQIRVNMELAKTNWQALPEMERLTKYRAAKEAITARILREEEAKQAREAEAAAKEATDWLAIWTAGGRRDGH